MISAWGTGCREQHNREVEEIRLQQEADAAQLEAEREAKQAQRQLEGLHLRQYLDHQVRLVASCCMMMPFPRLDTLE